MNRSRMLFDNSVAVRVASQDLNVNRLKLNRSRPNRRLRLSDKRFMLQFLMSLCMSP